VVEPWVPAEGYLAIPEVPGWGIDVNEEALARYPQRAWRRGDPRRLDNSPAFI
jgi:galactonate dehydratase